MNLGVSEEQQALIDSFAQLFAKESNSESVRETEPGGFDPSLWASLGEVGVTPMGVAEEAGGWGAGMIELALVAEQVGRASAPAPVIESQVAARLLAGLNPQGAAAEVLNAALEGSRILTIAVRPVVGGVATMAPAGAICDAMLVLDGDRLLLATVTDADRTPVANLGDAPLADVRLADGAIELASGADAVERFETAIDEWLTLTANAMVGLGLASQAIACEYARERQAFGAPIGTFQGISHPLADAATNLDGAQLIARKAAWALAVGHPDARMWAAMAFAFAARSAEHATYTALHTHGGYGFMLEYDVQLHYRRVRGWSRVWGDAEVAYRRAAAAKYGAIGSPVAARPSLAPGEFAGMVADGLDFAWSTEADELRLEVRKFLAEHLPQELEDQIYVDGVSHNDDFARALGERHWIAPNWERPGFEPLTHEQSHVLTEELTKVDAPIIATSTSTMVASVIEKVGPQEMIDEILPKVMVGDITISLGMSEPEAGSDVATVQAKARAVDGGWVIDGSKMFTTNGHLTEYVFMLVRTDPESSRHRGLTTFLLPMDLEGVEAQAVYTVSGERTNITYYNEVFVEDRWRISEVGAGWASLMLALQDEHSAPFSPHLWRLVEATEAWAAQEGPDGWTPFADTDARQRIIKAATELEVAQLLEARASWMESIDVVPVAEGPMSKLFSTEAAVRHSEDLAGLAGPDGLRRRLDPTALQHGKIEHGMRHALGMTIYAGSSEVQRNIIAQTRCGLPRGR